MASGCAIRGVHAFNVHCMFRFGYEVFESILDKIVQKEFLIESRSDPNIVTQVPDLDRLCSCRYIRIRHDTFITNRCDLLRYSMMTMVILFTIKMEGDHDFSYDQTPTDIFIYPDWPYLHITTERRWDHHDWEWGEGVGRTI